MESRNGDTTTKRSNKMLFATGQIVVTPGAHEALLSENLDPTTLLARHMAGDWGDLSAEDAERNDDSLRLPLHIGPPEQLLSSYNVGTGKVWIITEWDRSVTTFLLPDEY